MATMRPPSSHLDDGTEPDRFRPGDRVPARRSDDVDLLALREENRQLRELVIQLSRLVIRNVVERK